MRTTISHALDPLQMAENDLSEANVTELLRVIRRVQSDYLEIVENALSLLVQDRNDECVDYLREERHKLNDTREQIGSVIGDEDRWPEPFQRLVIEYLFTRARLVDEIRMFPDIAMELLGRMTLDQSLAETVSYLETAMTGKHDLFNSLLAAAPRH